MMNMMMKAMNMMNEHDFTATLQFGTVAEVDDKKHMVRVDLPALENLQTDWLPMITLAAGGNQFYSLPDVGALVVCLLDARGENGVCLGAIYNDADPVPATSRDLHVLQYSNGTRIQHNRKTGDVLVKTKGKVTIDAPNTDILGDVHVSGSLNAGGDISASEISLQNHVHTEQGDGATTSSAQ